MEPAKPPLYLNDTLTEDTKVDVERLSKANLVPHQIYDWRREQDSLKAIRARARKLKQDSMKIAKASQHIKDSINEVIAAAEHKRDSARQDSMIEAMLVDWRVKLWPMRLSSRKKPGK